MGFRSCTLVLLACALLAAFSDAQKAPRFKACKRSQPPAKLNECVRDALQRAVPELVKGLPNVGLDTIDPLRVDSLKVPKGKGSVSLELEFKNMDIYGMRYIKIKSVDVDVEKYRMKVKMDIDGPINLVGDYTVGGKVLVLPITGAGKANITITKSRGEITELLAKPVTKNGKQYAQVTSLKFINTDPQRVYYSLENLFNGNKALGDNMNLVLNDNWKQIFEDTRIPFQKSLSEAFRNVADKVLQGVPYDEIFPK